MTTDNRQKPEPITMEELIARGEEARKQQILEMIAADPDSVLATAKLHEQALVRRKKREEDI